MKKINSHLNNIWRSSTRARKTAVLVPIIFAVIFVYKVAQALVVIDICTDFGCFPVDVDWDQTLSGVPDSQLPADIDHPPTTSDTTADISVNNVTTGSTVGYKTYNTVVNTTLSYGWNRGTLPQSDSSVTGYVDGLANPNITIGFDFRIYDASTNQVIPEGATIPSGKQLILKFNTYTSDNIYWFGTGYSQDSPYGEWRASAVAPARVGNEVTCIEKDLTANYDYVYGGEAPMRFDVFIPLVVNPPTRTLSNTTGLSCGALTANGDGSQSATCTASGSGTITPTFNFTSTYGRFYYRYYDHRDMTSMGWGPAGCYGNNIALSQSPGSLTPYQVTIPAQVFPYPLTIAPASAAPNAPTVSCPSSVTTGQDITATLTSTDPDGDQVKYAVGWYSTTAQDSGYTSLVNSGTAGTITKTGGFSTAGTYTVTGWAQDSNSSVSSAGSCSVTVTAGSVINGACGSANGGSFASAPATGLCATGNTATAVAGGAGPWTWGCNGSGGGTNTTATACSASVASAVATCDWYEYPLTATCSASPSVAAPGSLVTWTVSASGGWYNTCYGFSGSYSYQWNGSDGLSGTSTQTTKTKTYSTEGTKTASVAVLYGNDYIIADCPAMNVSATPKPDLSASDVSVVKSGWSWGPPSSIDTAEMGQSINLETTITNSGNAGTGSGFTDLFQISNNANGTGATDIATYNHLTALGNAITYWWGTSGGTDTVSVSYVFPTSGIYYVRSCADKSSATNNGTISELNETNNCGAWSRVVVTPPDSGPLTAMCVGTVTPNGVSSYSVKWDAFAGGGVSSKQYDWNDNWGNASYYSSYSSYITWWYYSTGNVNADLLVTDMVGNSTTASCSVSLGGLSGTDLTASQVDVTEVEKSYMNVSQPVVGVAVDISSDVNLTPSNADTGTGFTDLFQKADDVFGTNTVDIGTYANPRLPEAQWWLAETPKITYTFPAGDAGKRKYIRACADKASAGDTGIITEANDTNNCGAWFGVDVQPAPVPLSVVSCTPSPNPALTTQSVTWTVVTTGGDRTGFSYQWNVTGGSPSTNSVWSSGSNGGTTTTQFSSSFATVGSYSPRLTQPIFGGPGNTGSSFTPFNCTTVVVNSLKPNFNKPLITISGLGAFNALTGTYSYVDIFFSTANDGLGNTQSTAPYLVEVTGLTSVSGTIPSGLVPGAAGFNDTVRINGPITPGTATVKVSIDTPIATNGSIAEVTEGVADNTNTATLTVPPPDPGITLTTDRSQVRNNETATITWNTTTSYPGLTCQMYGPGILENTTSGSKTTPPVTAKNEYIFKCTEAVTKTTWQKSTYVQSQGVIQEI